MARLGADEERFVPLAMHKTLVERGVCLRETLRQRLAAEAKFTDADLETVVGLLDGPGVVKELNFGTYILLHPEWINAYAQAVIRTLRAEAKSLGCLPVQSIAAGKLIFQTQQAGGEVVEEKRLRPREEPIVLQAMEQMLLERKLCLRQEGNLVFPSYCGIEKSMRPVPPKYFIKIKKQSWVKYWLKQDRPVLLLIGTFPDEADELRCGSKERFADIRRMEISELRRRETKGGTQPVKQIVFQGERLDTLSVRRWREEALHRGLP